MKAEELNFILVLLKNGEISTSKNHADLLRRLLDEEIPGIYMKSCEIKTESIGDSRMCFTVTADIKIKSDVWVEWLNHNKSNN